MKKTDILKLDLGRVEIGKEIPLPSDILAKFSSEGTRRENSLIGLLDFAKEAGQAQEKFEMYSPHDIAPTKKCLDIIIKNPPRLDEELKLPEPLHGLHTFYLAKSKYWDRFEKVMEGQACQKLLHRNKLRARYFGYLYQVLAYSDVTYVIRNVLLDSFELPPVYLWEDEFGKKPWLISRSGCASIDREANTFAHWMMEKEQEKKVSVILMGLHTGFRDMLLASVMSLLRKPCILPVEPEELTEDAVCKYLLLFSTPKQSQEELDRPSDSDINFPHLKTQDYERIFRDRTMFAVKGVDTCFKKPNWPVFYAEGPSEKEMSLTGIRLPEIIGEGEMHRPKVRDPERAIMLDAANDAMMLALRTNVEYADETDRDAWEESIEDISRELTLVRKENMKLTEQLEQLVELLDQDDDEEPENDGKDDLEAARKRKLARLESMVSSLRNDIAEKKKEVEELKSLLDGERANREAAEQEFDALLQMQQEKAEPEEEDINNLDTSIFHKKKVIVLGGHKTWVRGMKSLHPDIEYYDHDVPFPPINAITSSDMIWFQVNAINHPSYYRAVALAKTNNIPFRFFTSAGHQFCRKQMVIETNEYFTGQKM